LIDDPTDIDPNGLQLESDAADEISRRIATLGVGQNVDRLRRMEQSVLRLERINSEVLATLQMLVSAVKKQ